MEEVVALGAPVQIRGFALRAKHECRQNIRTAKIREAIYNPGTN